MEKAFELYLSSGTAVTVGQALSDAFKAYPGSFGNEYWEQKLFRITVDNLMGLSYSFTGIPQNVTNQIYFST